MAVSKMICPECEKVLRPAKPVAEGKSVTCPQCGARFRAPAEDLDLAMTEPKPKKKSSKSSAGKGKDLSNKDKVKSSKGSPAPAAPAKGFEDDEDGGGTYGLIKEGDGEGNQQKINYAPDTSLKDLRGPAQEAVMPPTNMLILTAALGFFGWLGFIIALLIPTLLPLTDEEGRSNMPKNILPIGPGLGTPRQDTRRQRPHDPA